MSKRSCGFLLCFSLHRIGHMGDDEDAYDSFLFWKWSKSPHSDRYRFILKYSPTYGISSKTHISAMFSPPMRSIKHAHTHTTTTIWCRSRPPTRPHFVGIVNLLFEQGQQFEAHGAVAISRAVCHKGIARGQPPATTPPHDRSPRPLLPSRSHLSTMSYGRRQRANRPWR